jgi:hypothetical protein
MAPGGRAIFPQEPFRAHSEYLLPVRPLVLWGYTDMADSRWTWGTRYIQLRQDKNAKIQQKVGFCNTPGWAAYALRGDVFIKQFPYSPSVTYPDYGCNTETYTDRDMLELESLGGLESIPSGGMIELTETWHLFKAELNENEAELDQKLLPLIEKAAKSKP